MSQISTLIFILNPERVIFLVAVLVAISPAEKVHAGLFYQSTSREVIPVVVKYL